MRKTILLLSLVVLGLSAMSSCQTKSEKLVDENQPMSVRIAQSEMIRNPNPTLLDFVTARKWNYTNGLVCESILKVYQTYGNRELFDYAKIYADSMINGRGEIYGYRVSNYNIDHINPGKYLFRLYDITHEEKLKIAMDSLYSQLQSHPRTSDGGYWHKKVYPYQIWLDGIYMGDVFKAEYVSRFVDPVDYSDVLLQFRLAAKHTYDPATGLYKHAWDEKREQQWADPQTGQSSHIWGRAMGWFSMAIVDALDYIPEGTEGRDFMIDLLQRMADSVIKYQDEETGGWYQVMELPGEHGNYIETTCTSMFAYSLLKGVRKGYLDPKYTEYGKKAYNGLFNHFVSIDEQGIISLHNCCSVAGLGGNPYRDGSYDYYISEEVRDNDPKGIGPLILAGLEMEQLK